jgi:hypothetical protein
MDSDDIVACLDDYFAEMQRVLAQGETSLFSNLVTVYFDLLASFADEHRVAKECVFECLRGRRLRDLPLDESGVQDILVALAVRFFDVPGFRRTCFEWMLDVLARPKVGGVDLTRGRIESFVRTHDDLEVRGWLVTCLVSGSQYLREEAADLLGAMRASEATPALTDALVRESNPYVARSIFEALGNCGESRGAQAMLAWLRGHIDQARTRELRFLLAHARKAISQIDRRCGSAHTETFEELLSQNGLMLNTDEL